MNKKVAFDFITLNVGGGKTLKYNIVKDLNGSSTSCEVHVQKGSFSDSYLYENIKIVEWSKYWVTNPILRVLYAVLILPIYLRIRGISVVFNFTDLPIFWLGKQIYHFDWPYGLYQISDKRLTFLRRIKWIFSKIMMLFVSATIVQSNYVKKTFGIRFPKMSIHVIPSIFGLDFQDNQESQPLKDLSLNETVRYLFPADYYPHKGWDIVSRLLSYSTDGLNIVLYTTLRDKDYRELCRHNPSPQIELINLGRLTHRDLISQYMTLDAVFFPSREETLGLPYIEAMLLEKPLLVANTEIAREICGTYAEYFTLDDMDSLIDGFRRVHARTVWQTPERIKLLVKSSPVYKYLDLL